MVSFDSLSSVTGLTVYTSEQGGLFEEAVSSKPYISSLQSEEWYPAAVLVAESVEAIQSAVKFCSQNDLRVSVRCGGHNVFSIWLQGKNSVILDVGKLDQVQFDEDSKCVSVGPGAIEINSLIPDTAYFPGGHGKGVPVGGFLLGGGYGIGYPKYGMSVSLVKQVEVVLADGQIKTAKNDDDDPISQAIMHMIRGSFHKFPAVITKYTIQTVPTATYVLVPKYIFPVKEWKRVVTMARDIAHRGDPDACSIETIVFFAYAPPPIAKATGVSRMVILSLIMFCDSKQEADALLNKYIPENFAKDTLVPPGPFDPTTAKGVLDRLPPGSNKARFVSDGWLADETWGDKTDEEVFNVLQPIADMWLSDNNEIFPGPPSYSMIPFMPKNLRLTNGVDMAFGFTPSFAAFSYLIHFDETKDDVYKRTLREVQSGFPSTAGIYTHMAEGNIRDQRAKCFEQQAQISVEKCIELLDPTGVFSK